MLAEWDKLSDPRQRLRAWLANSARYQTLFARYGCPYGTLAAELDKDDGGLTILVGGLLQQFVDWAELQYRELGAGDQAHDRAVGLVASVQGAYLLTNALRDPNVLAQQTAAVGRGTGRNDVGGLTSLPGFSWLTCFDGEGTNYRPVGRLYAPVAGQRGNTHESKSHPHR